MKTLFFQESMFLFVAISILTIVIGTYLFYTRSRYTAFLIIWYLFLILSLCIFYRVPSRKFIPNENNIIASSDGVVKEITYLPNNRVRIVAFLNIFNQHLQFYPVSGKVSKTEYILGSFHPAYLLEKSNYNERFLTYIQTENDTIVVTQIAGQIARRIVNNSVKDISVKQGAYMGMIKLSSRVDLEFSSDVYTPLVKIGDKLSALETIIAVKK